jgi:hypothetical protein
MGAGALLAVRLVRATLVFRVIVGIIRDQDRGARAKGAWITSLLLHPALGTCAYVIVRRQNTRR